MNKVLDTIKNLLSRLRGQSEPASDPASRGKPDRFMLISWGITWLIVISALGFALWRTQAAGAAFVPEPTAAPDASRPKVGLPPAAEQSVNTGAIDRALQLKTVISGERPRYEAVTYRVVRGDAMLAIAKEYNLKSETILYVNTVLEDNPHNLRPGMELTIPPVDGLFYEWKPDDTVEAVAAKFKAEPEDILNFPGNDLDLTNPVIKPGTKVMIPGGSRELRNWEADLMTVSRSNTGSTGTSDFGSNSCGGGPVGSGFGWPAGSHVISGNGYGPGHLGIDIQGNVGEPAYAASSGVVTMAQGGWNYGYGTVVQIDHGNGYVTVYAHLSQYNVSQCQGVGQGTLIGLIGSTGNSFGSHLHFEIRYGGTNINPLEIVQ
jgi:murein DD-endopeptidase MepM/ murein hydrolase activator NlpD